MNFITLLLDNWRLFAATVLIGAVVNFYVLWQFEKSDFAEFKLHIEIEARKAEEKAREINALHEKTLKEVKNDYEKKLPSVRAGAVAAYRATHPGWMLPPAGSSQVPGDAGSAEGSNGAGEECVLDEPFISDAAEDALKINAWQEWARKNNLQVR